MDINLDDYKYDELKTQAYMDKFHQEHMYRYQEYYRGLEILNMRRVEIENEIKEYLRYHPMNFETGQLTVILKKKEDVNY